MRPEWFSEGNEQAVHVARGAEQFRTHCATCHGERGVGDGPGAVGLQDVWGFTITPADLTLPSHKSGSTPEDLFRTIALGLDGTPMAGYRPALSDAAIWDLVIYIRSIEKK